MSDLVALGFGRQKRGLVVVSGVLIFLYFAQPTYQNAVIPFFQMEIANREVIPASIWALFVFYAIRWVQYFYQSDKAALCASFSNDALPVVRCFRRALWARHAADRPDNSNSWIMNFRGRVQPEFYLYTSGQNDTIYLSTGNVQDQENISGPYTLPLYVSVIAGAKAAIQNVFLRPLFLETFFPPVLAVLAVYLWYGA